MSRPGALRAVLLGVVLPWAASGAVHAGLAVLIWLLPVQALPPSQPPIEIVDRKPPPPLEQPKPAPEPAPEPEPEQAAQPAPPPRVAMTRRLPPRVRPRQEPPTEEPPSREPPPQDTGPLTFGDHLEGSVTAPPGQGVPIPQGDSMRVSPQITKKGKAPEKKATTGFKKDYASGEEAPVAVITAYPKVLKQVTAEYPDRMKELGIEGKVVLELTVSASGKVTGVRLVKTLHAELDRVAMAAARQLLFSPALVGKTPVQVKIPYTFTFVLD